MTGSGSDVTMDALTSAVVESARHAAGMQWGGDPRLYALVRREALGAVQASLSVEVSAAPGDALIPIEQDPLPDGDPAEALAGIRWPPQVDGCVLVTEVVVDDRRGDHPGNRGRLTVGVLRTGTRGARYACALQVEGDEDLVVSPDLADDLVTALLGTL